MKLTAAERREMERDVACCHECARNCRVRAAMAWSDAARDKFRRMAESNEKDAAVREARLAADDAETATKTTPRKRAKT